MEIIRGKHASFYNASAFTAQWMDYETVHIDIGTGDGRFVQHMAQMRPDNFVIGVDASRENLREVSRRAPANALFVIANALALPTELNGLAEQVTINFPWGSLLTGLLADDPMLMTGLTAIARPNAAIEVRLNAGALAESSWSLEQGADRVRDVLVKNGLTMRPPSLMTASDLRSFPTTWAKRLAFGRDPRAVCLRGAKKAAIIAPITPVENSGYKSQILSELRT